MAKTRGVFALILVPERKHLLVQERADGKGWELPGGGVLPGENDFTALAREVTQETGLIVEPLEQVGTPLIFQEDTALAFTCKIESGALSPTEEARQHRFVTKEEIRSLTLLGPTGRLGRMARMIWDGFSLMEEPATCDSCGKCIEGIFLSDDGCLLIEDDGIKRHTWPRLDPYSPTGKVEPNPQ